MVSQGVGGHEGYSGTPLWKIQQQNAAQREAALQESLAYAAEKTKPVIPCNVFAGAVSVGGPSAKPFARHVIVKCLRRVANNSKVELPTQGIFHNQAPIGLFALFDGQSGAGEAGPAAAEFCARNFHKKVLDNLASLPPGATDETFVKATLVKSFEDLDKELLDTQPDIRDGCGAAVALMIGEYIFSAVIGTCDACLCEASPSNAALSYRLGGTAVPLGRNQGRCHIPEERARLQRAGCGVVGEGPSARAHGAPGVAAVSRCLGDPAWKPPAVLSCVPEIHSFRLSWAEKHLFLMLASKPVAEALSCQDMVDRALGFPAQPRAACGEITNEAIEKFDFVHQCTAVQVWLLPGGAAGAEIEDPGAGMPGEAPKKRPRLAGSALPAETKSARLRHILVRFQEGAENLTPAQRKAMGISRTRSEAEALMRKLLRDFRVEMEDLRRRHGKTKKPEDLALKSEKFPKLCKEHSVCPTAQKGGGMCGDLGWMPREAQRKLGIEFQNAVSVLRPGDWSDIVASGDGLHIIQRIA